MVILEEYDVASSNCVTTINSEFKLYVKLITDHCDAIIVPHDSTFIPKYLQIELEDTNSEIRYKLLYLPLSHTLDFTNPNLFDIRFSKSQYGDISALTIFPNNSSHEQWADIRTYQFTETQISKLAQIEYMGEIKGKINISITVANCLLMKTHMVKIERINRSEILNRGGKIISYGY